MLNRRTLRIKAMQTVFAYWQCKESNYHIAIDLIKEAFAPDLNSMEVQDKDVLDSQKKEALILFNENFKNESVKSVKTESEKVNKVVLDTISYYHHQNKKDFDFFKKQMVIEAEKITDRYLLIILLLVEFAKLAEEDKKQDASNFVNNLLIKAVKFSNSIESLSLRRNLSWTDALGDVRMWYKEVLKKDEDFLIYLNQKAPSKEEDQEIVNHILKKLIFKSEAIMAYMEEQDINWSENKAIVRSMASKTLKSYGDDGEVEVSVLSYNWEEDKEFFIDLFTKSVYLEEEYKDLIAKKTKNWDIERIAGIDRVILQMALCEMVHFSSIPVKVTINEYIEISKNYSTPKSKQFINGILDVIAQELTEGGTLRKSGRGLIDNK